MSEHERRLVLRGMSLARGILKNTNCDHHVVVRNYQEQLAVAWDLQPTPTEEAEFVALVKEINDAIAQIYPDWINRDGQKWRPH
jgi:hypothetical protein